VAANDTNCEITAKNPQIPQYASRESGSAGTIAKSYRRGITLSVLSDCIRRWQKVSRLDVGVDILSLGNASRKECGEDSELKEDLLHITSSQMIVVDEIIYAPE
jgi:hypothetical protein